MAHSTIEFPSTELGHVVIGIGKHEGQVVVYAYHGVGTDRVSTKFPYDSTTGHVLWLVEEVSAAADKAGASAISYSSSVDFWEEEIA